MKVSQLIAVAAALVVAVLLVGAGSARADVPESPEIVGVVQDWRAEPAPGFMVVGGVRYQFGPDFVLLSEASQPLPAGIVRVGATVRFTSYDGVVETVILVSDGTRQ